MTVGKAQTVDPSVTLVEEQQIVLVLIVVEATQKPVDVNDPVTEQPTVVLVSVEQSEDVPTELHDTVVKVAVLLVHDFSSVVVVSESSVVVLSSLPESHSPISRPKILTQPSSGVLIAIAGPPPEGGRTPPQMMIGTTLPVLVAEGKIIGTTVEVDAPGEVVVIHWSDE